MSSTITPGFGDSPQVDHDDDDSSYVLLSWHDTQSSWLPM